MKLRIKFSKQGNVKFVGHLDVMRYFQKAIRRANLPVRYSEGFSPHMVMSFASPLGVGLLSNGEYVDIELTEPSKLSSDELCACLNAAMAQGFEVKSVRELPDTAKNAMSIVAAADYKVWFREGYEPCWETFCEEFQTFCNRPAILITKATKRNKIELDIRPLIYAMHLNKEEHSVFMQLSSGSADNLKPELVLGAFYKEKGEELSPLALIVEREEVYGFTDKEKTQFAALESFGRVFPGVAKENAVQENTAQESIAKREAEA
ncbi:MAG: TIGR03936 family radical SAM-associated protein [bacterium]|nr:TIGR03936 family radical SAM-associated protein [bacterium]